jgi:hypothetical protein
VQGCDRAGWFDRTRDSPWSGKATTPGASDGVALIKNLTGVVNQKIYSELTIKINIQSWDLSMTLS